MVGPKVILGDEVELVSHVVIAGRTTIGARTKVFPFASLGHQPQDLKYAGEDTLLEIGEDNQIREHSTMNPGTAGGGGVTRIGHGGLFMMGSHVGMIVFWVIISSWQTTRHLVGMLRLKIM